MTTVIAVIVGWTVASAAAALAFAIGSSIGYRRGTEDTCDELQGRVDAAEHAVERLRADNIALLNQHPTWRDGLDLARWRAECDATRKWQQET